MLPAGHFLKVAHPYSALRLKLTCLSTVMMMNSKEKHMMYPEWRPCQTVRKKSVMIWDSDLLPRILNRLKTFLRKGTTNRRQGKSYGSSLFGLKFWMQPERFNASAITAYMVSTHSPETWCCIATEVIKTIQQYSLLDKSTQQFHGGWDAVL